MRTPAVVINFKAYPEVCGEKGLALGRLCQEVAVETGKEIVVAPQQCDLALFARELTIPVFAQHIDAVAPGGRTGHVTALAGKEAGAKGTLINHSERRMLMADVEAAVAAARREGLTSIVCTNNLAVSRACCVFAPDFVAVEPPELIGGDISVTTADPGIVENTVKALRDIDPGVKTLTGAGVKTGGDVAKAIELGTDGVLLASGVVKAKDVREVLMDLAGGLG
jgi:triosephosphate isomerase